VFFGRSGCLSLLVTQVGDSLWRWGSVLSFFVCLSFNSGSWLTGNVSWFQLIDRNCFNYIIRADPLAPDVIHIRKMPKLQPESKGQMTHCWPCSRLAQIRSAWGPATLAPTFKRRRLAPAPDTFEGSPSCHQFLMFLSVCRLWLTWICYQATRRSLGTQAVANLQARAMH